MKWHDLPTRYTARPQLLRSQSPHQILQVSENASLQEVRTAYRRLVKVYHPDKSHPFLHANNEEVLKIINQAYRTLLHRLQSKP